MPTESAAQPMTPIEERVWRTLIRLMVAMPRAIDEDLSRRGGPSLTRCGVLTKLSEAPDRALRMSDLAEAASISPSRLTRIIAPMATEGLVTREAAADDGRASVVALTDRGLRRLNEAWPAHLAGVRALVLDHIDPDEMPDLIRVTERLLQAITKASDAAGSGQRSAGR